MGAVGWTTLASGRDSMWVSLPCCMRLQRDNRGMSQLLPDSKAPSPVTLIGRHVRLEPLTRAHLPDLYAAGGGDDEVWRWLSVPTPHTEEEMGTLLDGLLADCRAGIRVAFAVVRRSTGRAVGWTSYGFFNARDARLEIGRTWYGRDAWRTAVNSESKLLLLSHAFEDLGMARVSWRADRLNTRSRQAITRLGAACEGVFRHECRRPDGSWRDNVYYAMLRHQWPSAKAQLSARLAAGPSRTPAVGTRAQVPVAPAKEVGQGLVHQRADVWLVLGAGLEERPITGLIADALANEFGDRFAVMHSDELLMGVQGGRLTLRDLDGRELTAPALAYGRLWTPAASTEREIMLLRQLEAMGTVLLNPADSMLACLNKFWQVQQLALAGLPVPDTRTYASSDLEKAMGAGVPQPSVIKAARGHRGEQVFLALDTETYRSLQGSLSQDASYLFQEYVASSHGRDLRVMVVDGRAAGAVVRTAAEGEFRSNVALGASASPCSGCYPEGEELAVRAAGVLGLGVAGVDLLFTPDGSFTVCEVNANAGWREEMKDVTSALVNACRNRLTAAGQPAR